MQATNQHRFIDYKILNADRDHQRVAGRARMVVLHSTRKKKSSQYWTRAEWVAIKACEDTTCEIVEKFHVVDIDKYSFAVATLRVRRSSEGLIVAYTSAGRRAEKIEKLESAGLPILWLLNESVFHTRARIEVWTRRYLSV